MTHPWKAKRKPNCYKVVCIDPNYKNVYWSYLNDQETRVKYVPHVPTKPIIPNSKLFVFPLNALKEAKQLIYRYGEACIFMAYAENMYLADFNYPCSPSLNGTKFYWENYKESKSYCIWTHWADSVTLLKKAIPIK